MINTDKQASQLLVSDLAENILRYSDNPGDCATYITAQIRELIGVRIVAITTEDELVENKLVAICPPRKETIWKLPEIHQFLSIASTYGTPCIIDTNSDIGTILSSIDIGASFIVPLKVGEQRVGMLVLFDLLDLKGATTILDALTRIAPILALILKNSILYKNMENMVEARTIQLAKSEQLFRALFEQANDGIFFLDTHGEVVSANEAFARSHGYTVEEMKQLGIEKLDVEGNAPVPERIRRIMAGEALSFEVKHFHKDGHIIPLDVTANLISIGDEQLIIAIHRDITERKQAEEEHLKYENQLQLNSKLESLGVLAGGIAHDFNNLMGGIFGYIDMASEESKEAKVTSYLSKAMNTIDRARALTLQLLTFAKGGAPIQQIGNLFPFVQETVQFALSGANVSCHVDVPQDLWACNFDKNQIGQVIDNLIINAQQAMPVGGTIELTARNITLAEKEHPMLANGNYVKISVKDTGVGIPQELISKIFDPFFTTKAKGHGLGLATCYSIVKRHDGCIDVESEPGKGSTFKVYLPATTESASSEIKKTDKTHKGSGTFLIMDDEEVMRDTIGDMLETLGYSVVSKENGKDAIDFFATETKANRKISGIIFDLTIPGGMGGKAAIEEIRKLNKDIPAFVASGYADDPVMKKPTEHGFTASICKPFRKSELSEMLNKYMNPKK